MAKKFYITTAIPYVNAPPHVGHALEFVQADCIAKYHRLLGEDVTLLSGGDENALKNVQAAETAGVPVQEFIDTNTQLFKTLAEKLNVQFDVFQKGSDINHHYLASQKLWNLCKKNGDIYEKEYSGLYCLGCEAFYTSEELNENGECFEHPGKKLETISEKNYFFQLSKYQQQLIDLIEKDTLRIVPDFRKNEVLSFLKQPLQDISISRSNKRAKNWGVPVPDDDSQRMYVWFDALNIYQSGIGFAWNEKEYKKWWPADVHVIGKGISRFHAVYWPAFLLSAKLNLPKTLFVHGYFTVNGQKMSKTLGNVIDPVQLIEKYGAEALRYYFLSKFSPFHDGDFSEKEFITTYNADLANGIGNLVARTVALIVKTPLPLPIPFSSFHELTDGNNEYAPYVYELEQFQLDRTLAILWAKIKALDIKINEKAPWKMPEKERGVFLLSVAQAIVNIATLLYPFLPETSEKVLKQFKEHPIKIHPSLFPRL
jgi:methionyl-tRNA synthetase